MLLSKWYNIYSRLVRIFSANKSVLTVLVLKYLIIDIGLTFDKIIFNDISKKLSTIKIDGNKLRNNNILKLKHKSNNNSHPNIKFQRISQTLSDILYDIIKG